MDHNPIHTGLVLVAAHIPREGRYKSDQNFPLSRRL